MNRILTTLGALALAAQVAAAQSVPNIMKTKQSAQKAAAATNAHTKAVTTLPEDTTTVAAAQRATADSVSRQRVSTDSAAGSTSVTSRGAAFERETFEYERGGRRDPFISLMSTSELRPLISDLRIVGIVNDATGRGSVAILRDLNTKEQYRIRTGQSLGRMRVAHIAEKSVTFTIEEFGYSRQEVLSLSDSNKARKQ